MWPRVTHKPRNFIWLVQTVVQVVGKQISFTITKNFFKACIIFSRSLDNHNRNDNHFYMSACTKIHQSSQQLIYMEYEIITISSGNRKQSSEISQRGCGLAGMRGRMWELEPWAEAHLLHHFLPLSTKL